MRDKLNFNENWYFHKGNIQTNVPNYKAYMYMSSKTERMQTGPACRHYALTIDEWYGRAEHKCDNWERVTLPHDFVIQGTPTSASNGSYGFLEKDDAWYIKSFSLNEEDKKKRITLLFEGVASECTVYVNGCIVKRNFSGYNSFEADVTDFVKFGEENRVAVFVQAKDVHEGWWYEGGGIYRNVWLIKTDLISVDTWGVYVRSEKQEQNWKLCVETSLRNDFYEDKNIRLKCEILDGNGVSVANAEDGANLEKTAVTTLKTGMYVEEPILWSPDVPYLYTARVTVYENGEERDVYETRFGFRTFYIDPQKGLFINDKHYTIKGVCGHADCGMFGKAVPDTVHRYKVKLLKEMGANGYRTAHYMQSETLMDALDENGFIVMDETRWFSTDEESVNQLISLIKRDRNRPSVFFWSVGNEEPHHVTEEGRRIYQKLASIVKKLDDTRPVMTAVSYAPNRATVYEDCDVLGINYNWDLYDNVHEKFPNKGVFCSEGGATGTTRGWYFDDDAARGYISAYDHDVNKSFISRERVWKFVLERPWLLGYYQWTSFDHRGESAWPRLSSQSGAFDMFLQKKDAFYQNQSHWTNEPMVHLLPHWNFRGLEGKPVRVVAYTNTPVCELFLNGESLGKREVEKGGHAEWTVAYASGKIQAIGYDNQGKAVAEAQKETTGKAEKLALKVEEIGTEENGEKIALITCFAVDSNAKEVEDGCAFVRFNADGDGKIVGGLRRGVAAVGDEEGIGDLTVLRNACGGERFRNGKHCLGNGSNGLACSDGFKQSATRYGNGVYDARARVLGCVGIQRCRINEQSVAACGNGYAAHGKGRTCGHGGRCL